MLAIAPHEPYQETNIASPDEVKAFEQQERTEILERKLSKRSIFSRRRSSKRIAGPSPQPPRNASHEMEYVEQHQREHQAQPDGRSIVPDILKELPPWYHDSPTYYSSRFPLHNPIGPRLYINHHLLPYRVNTRPPTVFSPSFPPLKTEERTPSHSPQPTPSSSETRVQDTASKPRSRKNSQTAHDGVDLMDVTDPWGTNWHHGSPYDIGLSNGPVSPEVETVQRSRRSSQTTKETRRRTITPSPLSQSTSAVNLQLPDSGAQLPRKLSKRRTPVAGNLFPPKGETSDSNRISRTLESYPSAKRASTIPPAFSAPPVSFRPPSEKSSRRGSVLGRLVKRFSLMKKAGDTSSPDLDESSKRVSVIPPRQPSPVKRVPAPQVTPDSVSPSPTQHYPPPAAKNLETDHSSVSSVEQPFSIGKLTVANPDAPSEGGSTPLQLASQLPDPENVPTMAPEPPSFQFPETKATVATLREPVLNETEPVTNEMLVSDSVVPQQSGLALSAEVVLPVENVGEQEESDAARDEKPIRTDQPPFVTASPTDEPQASVPHPSLQDTLTPFPMGARPSSVTFPPASPLVPQYLTSLISSDAYDQSDGSPLSTASILANPPTPHVVGRSMPAEDSEPPALPPKRSSIENKRSQRDPSPGFSRQTETFKLVRSSSGTVYASSETIHAAGEQWEVMEASPPKSREGRKESKRWDQPDSEKRAKSSQRAHKRSSAETTPNKNKPLPQANSAERHVTSHPAVDTSRTNKRDKSAEALLNLNKPQPPPPPPTPGPSVARPLERAPSVSARPTSEVPSAADLNALRAKEAWEMERLWKARSLYGAEANGLTAPAPVNASSALVMNESNPTKGAHGSSHTSFIVQTPFQPQLPGQHLYHPSVQVYSSQLQKGADPRPSRSYDTQPLLDNPLPEPPRESPYQPAPIPNLLDSSSVHSSDYWTKYGGVTTAH